MVIGTALHFSKEWCGPGAGNCAATWMTASGLKAALPPNPFELQSKVVPLDMSTINAAGDEEPVMQLPRADFEICFQNDGLGGRAVMTDGING